MTLTAEQWDKARQIIAEAGVASLLEELSERALTNSAVTCGQFFAMALVLKMFTERDPVVHERLAEEAAWWVQFEKRGGKPQADLVKEMLKQ